MQPNCYNLNIILLIVFFIFFWYFFYFTLNHFLTPNCFGMKIFSIFSERNPPCPGDIDHSSPYYLILLFNFIIFDFIIFYYFLFYFLFIFTFEWDLFLFLFYFYFLFFIFIFIFYFYSNSVIGSTTDWFNSYWAINDTWRFRCFIFKRISIVLANVDQFSTRKNKKSVIKSFFFFLFYFNKKMKKKWKINEYLKPLQQFFFQCNLDL